MPRAALAQASGGSRTKAEYPRHIGNGVVGQLPALCRASDAEGYWTFQHGAARVDRHVMRVVFVNCRFGSGCVQGTERYLETLGTCLAGRGHEVSYLAGEAASGKRSAGSSTSSALQEASHPMGGPVVIGYPTRGWMSVMGVWPRRLERWLGQWRPDVLHLANPAFVGVGAMRACRRLNIPVVVTIMDYWWVCPKTTLLRPDGRTCDGTPAWRECVRCLVRDHARQRVRWLGRMPIYVSPMVLGLYFARAALRGMSPAEMGRWTRRRQVLMSELDGADAIIFPSRAVADLIAPRLNHDRWRIISYGLSREWFVAPRPTAESDDNRPLTIGFAGAILPHKAPHLLLAAVRKLGWRDCLVRLAGPASDAQYLATVKIAARGLNVESLGPLPSERMPAFLRSLDLLVVTSVWPENLPLVVLEAQAAGVPVIGSNVPGVAEQIADRNLLFEPGSAESLAAALVYARAHRGRLTPGRVSTAEDMTDATEAVYRKAMDRSKPDGARMR